MHTILQMAALLIQQQSVRNQIKLKSAKSSTQIFFINHITLPFGVKSVFLSDSLPRRVLIARLRYIDV